jgi:hypothetical protein
MIRFSIMADDLTRKLLEQKLDNRTVLALYDRSRQIAGDRWVIRIHGEARFPMDPNFFSHIDEEDPELLSMVKERLGNELVFTLSRERNFVSEEEKEQLISELVGKVRANLTGYLGLPEFPEKLFRKQYEEQKRKAIIDREIMSRREAAAEEEFPADFPSCFMDKKGSSTG